MNNFQYLKPSELKSLSKVPTTIEQAEIILERNQDLFDQLLTINPFKTITFENNIGCPHCNNYKCLNCAWNTEDKSSNSATCCSQNFGGISLNKIAINFRFILIEYGCNDAALKSCMITSRTELKIWNKHYIECYKFLQGHIEWAKAIIEGKRLVS